MCNGKKDFTPEIISWDKLETTSYIMDMFVDICEMRGMKFFFL